jgi:hypothetical protein
MLSDTVIIFLYFFLKYFKSLFESFAFTHPSFISSAPFSKSPFKICISPSLILPKLLRGSSPSSHFITIDGDTVLRLILCSARYLSLLILG